MPPHSMLLTACWILRIALAGQCLGVAVALLLGTYESEADIYGLLFFDLEWSEATALAVEDAGTWAYLAAGALVVLIPLAVSLFGQRKGLAHTAGTGLQISALAWIFLWQATLSGLHAWRGGSFMVEWAVGAHAVRIFAPLALILLLTLRPENGNLRRITVAEWVLRLATAATFAVHGLEAYWLNPRFVDLLIGSADHILAISLAESATTPILRVIGVVDIVVAVLIVVVRSRSLAAYMGIWGLLTACSRMTAGGLAGLALTYDDTLIRLANGGVPLALLALWIGFKRGSGNKQPNTTKTSVIPESTPEHEPEHA